MKHNSSSSQLTIQLTKEEFAEEKKRKLELWEKYKLREISVEASLYENVSPGQTQLWRKSCARFIFDVMQPRLFLFFWSFFFFFCIFHFLPFSSKIGERCVEVWASTSSLESQHLMEHICHEIARIRLRTICCNQMRICTFYGNFKNIKVSFCVGWLTFIIFRLTLQWLRESIVHPNKLHWHSLNDSTAIILHCRFIAIFNLSKVIV